MSALEVIRRVETLGGRVLLEPGGLRLRAAAPLPEDLVAAVGKEKVAIMLALGAPLNTAITSILAEIRPHLPPAMRKLPDERLMLLINWSIIAAFDRAVMKVSHDVSP
jgi:hypothetical protein